MKSIIKLADQYSRYIEEAKVSRMEPAADYLVMAAWLALIKSRLLLPKEQPEAASGEELASRLAFRLQRLQAMRDAAASLVSRKSLGVDFFERGDPDPVEVRNRTTFKVTVLDLMQAYARIKSRDDYRPYQYAREPIYSVEAAAENLVRLLGEFTPDWQELIKFLPREWRDEGGRPRSALASTFAATLELARSGKVELRQADHFAPLHLKAVGSTDDD